VEVDLAHIEIPLFCPLNWETDFGSDNLSYK